MHRLAEMDCGLCKVFLSYVEVVVAEGVLLVVQRLG